MIWRPSALAAFTAASLLHLLLWWDRRRLLASIRKAQLPPSPSPPPLAAAEGHASRLQRIAARRQQLEQSRLAVEAKRRRLEEMEAAGEQASARAEEREAAGEQASARAEEREGRGQQAPLFPPPEERRAAREREGARRAEGRERRAARKEEMRRRNAALQQLLSPAAAPPEAEGSGPAGLAVVMVGGVYVDEIHELEAFPAEDSACRSQACGSIEQRRGGNAANSSVVLAQLLSALPKPSPFPIPRVHWIGAVADPSQLESDFVLRELRKAGVLTEHAEHVLEEGVAQPKAIILLNRLNGSRTIISSRRGLRELAPRHFLSTLPALIPRLRWLHFECREMPSVGAMAAAAAAARDEAAAAAQFTLSVEIEKPTLSPSALRPLLRLADVIFFSREHIEAIAPALLPPPPRDATDHLALQCMRSLCSAAPPDGALWVCAWGALGVFALHTPSGRSFFEPAVRVAAVVDSVGAGDTFIAAAIHALVVAALRGEADAGESARVPSPELAQSALRFACRVAAHKISQSGLSGLLDREGLQTIIPC
ncbi:hypothetical protein AB1Y20_014105 [Prymnesium parvum]|uniref:Carbohydrate kinase PfkB domain-containing protein n=1 Tax=Prymnesium parvum TaxID=97485 RepID=A0AB34IEV1_PRYPA